MSKINPNKLEVITSLQELDAPDETWTEIRRLLADFFAQRAAARAAAVTDEEGWTDDDFHRLARTHMRTPYAS